MGQHPGNQGENSNPKEYSAWFKAIDRLPAFLDPQRIEINLGGDLKLGTATKKSALLLSGKDAFLWNTVADVRAGLLRSGYDKAKIKVLMSDGTAPTTPSRSPMPLPRRQHHAQEDPEAIEALNDTDTEVLPGDLCSSPGKGRGAARREVPVDPPGVRRQPEFPALEPFELTQLGP
jgi:hypothetical protein